MEGPHEPLAGEQVPLVKGAGVELPHAKHSQEPGDGDGLGPDPQVHRATGQLPGQLAWHHASVAPELGTAWQVASAATCVLLSVVEFKAATAESTRREQVTRMRGDLERFSLLEGQIFVTLFNL